VKLVGITARVDEHTYDKERRERRDALDQGWASFLSYCGLVPVLLFNHMKTSLFLIRTLPLVGIIFSGGNTLQNYGGKTPERDALEKAILDHAMPKRLPILGVCHGMQIIQHHFGGVLEIVPNHVGKHHALCSGRMVNSYHTYGTRMTTPDLCVLEKTEDGVVEAVAHRALPIKGLMWHPERNLPVDEQDVALFKRHFFI
jgi:putative glutamine amidotransferase